MDYLFFDTHCIMGKLIHVFHREFKENYNKLHVGVNKQYHYFSMYLPIEARADF